MGPQYRIRVGVSLSEESRFIQSAKNPALSSYSCESEDLVQGSGLRGLNFTSLSYKFRQPSALQSP